MNTLLESITNRLTSGNNVPVDRVRLSNDELLDISTYVFSRQGNTSEDKFDALEEDYNQLFNEVLISDGFTRANTLRPIIEWLGDHAQNMQRCGIPQCPDIAYGDQPICKDHLGNGYLTDYKEYRSLIEEGHTRYSAAVMSGLRDPDY